MPRQVVSLTARAAFALAPRTTTPRHASRSGQTGDKGSVYTHEPEAVLSGASDVSTLPPRLVTGRGQDLGRRATRGTGWRQACRTRGTATSTAKTGRRPPGAEETARLFPTRRSAPSPRISRWPRRSHRGGHRPLDLGSLGPQLLRRGAPGAMHVQWRGGARCDETGDRQPRGQSLLRRGRRGGGTGPAGDRNARWTPPGPATSRTNATLRRSSAGLLRSLALLALQGRLTHNNGSHITLEVSSLSRLTGSSAQVTGTLRRRNR